ncbi:iron-containing alcohol dehydrogenase [Mobilitalea sibirica]|uniref:Iron-containing alcohol dehydrogenase n=1 Tax=Mobilitalea sibirica TaxID=1462919 RepID=A0A8J7H0S1_9FIRM|nr:iron-containing alcohol dehydrogenase [Mobilitalea sibirica]MBH1939510.1 iron-containing alcohol dehydrogenase [Mobilitalea sibirica]
MYKIYCRLFQLILRAFSGFLPWRKPQLLEGENSLKRLPKRMKENGLHKILIVTDRGIMNLGLMKDLLSSMEAEELEYTIYDKTVPNPTIDNIEEALMLYNENKCDSILGFGGGTAIDCAKGVGARVARPKKTLQKMKGLLKVRKPLPPLIAVPTTAGTGSEATLAAVITDSKTHEKYAVNDTSLIPHYAVLDPLLTIKLPPHLTATTGMDALTHAVEAYIGRSNTKETYEYSKEAIKLIFNNLWKAYSNGEDLDARENMLKASYYAGMAFTRAYVGNVHAIAHTLGGFYNIPHGLANAVILPYVLDYYGEAVHKPLAELADLIGISKEKDSTYEKSKQFIEKIKSMNQQMGIPTKIKGIQDKDIPVMVDRACREANPLYPVPKVFCKKDFYIIYEYIKE